MDINLQLPRLNLWPYSALYCHPNTCKSFANDLLIVLFTPWGGFLNIFIYGATAKKEYAFVPLEIRKRHLINFPRENFILMACTPSKAIKCVWICKKIVQSLLYRFARPNDAFHSWLIFPLTNDNLHSLLLLQVKCWCNNHFNVREIVWEERLRKKAPEWILILTRSWSNQSGYDYLLDSWMNFLYVHN